MSTHSTHMSPSPRTGVVAGLIFRVAVGLSVTAILTAGARGAQVQPGLIDWDLGAVVAVLTVATFGLLVPWASRSPGGRAAATGLVLSITALVLSVMFFWTMV